ncbi:MAG: S6e family ribosomal protein [Candidatus Pacearchaeota archaeon]|nr:S6e family ribosomal protein [Candidatus Pacearchaeota archaeon]
MVFKLNISEKGKAWKIELDSEILIGAKLGDKIKGKEISPDLDGYELEITGATDFAGFPHKKEIEGPEVKKVLLTKGWGMHYKQKGLRRRKSIRGNQISEKTIQINFSVITPGKKSLKEIFPEQNKAPEKPEEKPKDNQVTDNKEIKEEVKEEIKEVITEEIKEDIPKAPETLPSQHPGKEEAAEKIAEEVAEQVVEKAPTQ